MIYRCDFCKKVVLESHIKKDGGCSACGGRRIRIARSLTDEEVETAKAEGYEFKSSEWSNEPIWAD